MRCSFLRHVFTRPMSLASFIIFLKTCSNCLPHPVGSQSLQLNWGLGRGASLALWGSTGLHVGDKACKGGGSEQLLPPRDKVTKLQKGKRPFLCIARKLKQTVFLNRGFSLCLFMAPFLSLRLCYLFQSAGLGSVNCPHPECRGDLYLFWPRVLEL